MTAIPPLPTVQCPVCLHQVVLQWYGELVPHHWMPGQRYRRSCPGEGAVVRRSGSGLVASMPAEPEEVAP